MANRTIDNLFTVALVVGGILASMFLARAVQTHGTLYERTGDPEVIGWTR